MSGYELSPVKQKKKSHENQSNAYSILPPDFIVSEALWVEYS